MKRQDQNLPFGSKNPVRNKVIYDSPMCKLSEFLKKSLASKYPARSSASETESARKLPIKRIAQDLSQEQFEAFP